MTTGSTTTRRAPTLVEVAHAAGVSRATASRAIRGGERVSREARDAVAAAVRELGYRPNPAARSLVTRRTDSIAVVIPETDSMLFTDPFFARVMHGVTSALAETDLQIALLVGKRGDRARKIRDYLEGGHADGAIVVSHHHGDHVAEAVSVTGMPSVLIGRPWDTSLPVTWVDVDNAAGGALAAERLLAAGARRLGMVAGPDDMGAAVDRLRGWRERVRAEGLDDSVVLHTAWGAPEGARATAQLLAEHPDLDGIFVASDAMAAAALDVLRESGRRVPEDVRVVGFDDMELAAHTRPPLTTIVNPAEDMARRAVQMVLDELGGGGRPEPVVLPTQLVVRGTA